MIGDNKFPISKAVNSLHPTEAGRLGLLRFSVLFSDKHHRGATALILHPPHSDAPSGPARCSSRKDMRLGVSFSFNLVM